MNPRRRLIPMRLRSFALSRACGRVAIPQPGRVAWLVCLATAHAATFAATDMLADLKKQALKEAVGALLDQQLPLKLDASTLYPSVATLPGDGPFNPIRLTVTAENRNRPLPPGDYVVRATAYCSEYSVHRSGAGAAYQVGPIQGRAAEAIAALLWRGTVVNGKRPRELQMVSFAIQSGVSYSKMPKTYQAVIDDVIPEFRGRLGADFVENLQDLYTARAKDLGLPPLNTLLAQLGKPGELVMAANRQRAALLRQNTTDQRRDQILYAGQEQRIAPIKPSEGPWTAKIPGVAYLRYRVVGGNMKANNEIQIRILPQDPPKVGAAWPVTRGAFGMLAPERTYLLAAVAPPKPKGPSLYELTLDGIGYSVSRAAQVLYFAPSWNPGSGPDAIGVATGLEGLVNLTRQGKTRPLTKDDKLQMNDTLSTGEDGKAHLLFVDDTQISLAPGATFTIDEYTYNPTSPDANGSSDSWLSGAFKYTSGLIAKEPGSDVSINTAYGNLGIRGTEFVGRYLPNTEVLEIHLISGSLLLSPKELSTSTLVTAPVTARFTANSVTTAPLTRRAYDGHKRPILIR